jgi:hypothetical protein
VLGKNALIPYSSLRLPLVHFSIDIFSMVLGVLRQHPVLCHCCQVAEISAYTKTDVAVGLPCHVISLTYSQTALISNTGSCLVCERFFTVSSWMQVELI